ncbi:MAG: hypothetical protein AB1641_02730 [Thermodesulfobacteriota bacterium]
MRPKWPAVLVLAWMVLNPAIASWSGGPPRRQNPEVLAAAARTQVTTVVTRITANAAQDGYIVETRNGRFELAYGAGGYGKWDEIYSAILDSLDKKKPVILILEGKDIQDVKPAR